MQKLNFWEDDYKYIKYLDREEVNKERVEELKKSDLTIDISRINKIDFNLALEEFIKAIKIFIKSASREDSKIINYVDTDIALENQYEDELIKSNRREYSKEHWKDNLLFVETLRKKYYGVSIWEYIENIWSNLLDKKIEEIFKEHTCYFKTKPEWYIENTKQKLEFTDVFDVFNTILINEMTIKKIYLHKISKENYDKLETKLKILKPTRIYFCDSWLWVVKEKEVYDIYSYKEIKNILSNHEFGIDSYKDYINSSTDISIDFENGNIYSLDDLDIAAHLNSEAKHLIAEKKYKVKREVLNYLGVELRNYKENKDCQSADIIPVLYKAYIKEDLTYQITGNNLKLEKEMLSEIFRKFYIDNIMQTLNTYTENDILVILNQRVFNYRDELNAKKNEVIINIGLMYNANKGMKNKFKLQMDVEDIIEIIKVIEIKLKENGQDLKLSFKVGEETDYKNSYKNKYLSSDEIIEAFKLNRIKPIENSYDYKYV